MNEILLVMLGLLCLAGAIVGVIFTILGFANNKQGKYAWLAAFLICLVGLIVCIVLFVRKAVHKAEQLATNVQQEMMKSMRNYSDSSSYTYSRSSVEANKHIELLKSYHADTASVPEAFYSYLGFEKYYRFPLTYPYAIHCNLFAEDGQLFNEARVKRFDENDNGERAAGPEHIDQLAFDQNWLLADQKTTSTRSADPIHHYVLFSFETEKAEEANSGKELLELARKKGYKGPGKLITLQQYNKLFSVEPASVEAE